MTRARSRPGQERRQEFLRHQAAGASLSEIADRLGVTTRTVSRWREEFGLSKPAPNNTFRVDEAWVEDVRRLLAEGMSISEVCRTKETTYNTIKRHIPEAEGWDKRTASEYAVSIRNANIELRKQGFAPMCVRSARYH